MDNIKPIPELMVAVTMLDNPAFAENKEELMDVSALTDFTAAMGEKLLQKRREGRGGWWDEEQCLETDLCSLLESHIQKAIDAYGVKDEHQLLDIANIAMMLWCRKQLK